MRHDLLLNLLHFVNNGFDTTLLPSRFFWPEVNCLFFVCCVRLQLCGRKGNKVHVEPLLEFSVGKQCDTLTPRGAEGGSLLCPV